jgi:hypothetical protein
MANSTISPNMNLIIPTVGTDPGPDWANNLNNSLSLIDSHNHTAGQGVQIPSLGLNINSDLTFKSNNATNLNSVQFVPTTLSTAGAVYESSAGDLWYNNGSGTAVQITSGNSVAVSGAIGFTGLPSGTASAAYLGSPYFTFRFQQATNVAANLDIGTITIRYPGSYPSPTGNYIQIRASSSLATQYSFTLPATTPTSSGAFLTSDTSGVLSYTNIGSTLSLSGGILSVDTGALSGITGSQLANNTITATQIANGTITGTQIQSNVELNGKPTILSGAINVTGTIGPTSFMYWGVIDSSGSIISGSGFSVSYSTPVNVYTINFVDQSFSSTPAVVAIAINNGGSAMIINSLTTTSVTLENAGGSATQFTFIAIGTY